MSDKLVTPNIKALQYVVGKMFAGEGADLDTSDLDKISEAIGEFRTNILFSSDGDWESMGLISKQDFLLGLNALEQAQRHFAKAAHFLAGEISGRF